MCLSWGDDKGGSGGREGRQGGSIGFEFARVGEMEDKWGVYVYEGHEVTKNREKLRCL